jgi:dCTP deaminase
MLSDAEIRAAIAEGLMNIEPLEKGCVQPASYDFRVGAEAFTSDSDSKIDVANRGLVIIEPGEFAVVTTRESVTCGPRIAGQIGLCSPYARQGLMLLSGPQIDPGFNGVLIVRLTNLAPHRITLAYEAAFLTAQFFKLARDVERPYSGSRQGQKGLGPKDIEALTNPDSPTLGGMVRSLTALAKDVSDLKTAVKWMAWAIGLGIAAMTIALTGVGIFAALK